MALLSMFLATGNGQYNVLNQLLQIYLPVHITYAQYSKERQCGR
jgi:hypothetical protein